MRSSMEEAYAQYLETLRELQRMMTTPASHAGDETDAPSSLTLTPALPQPRPQPYP